ncbi:MAG: acyl-CoA thioesterase [Sodaliphilus sp.]
MTKKIYSIDIKVRDYELDAEGIVNNANYLHYLEYTRHCFCEDNGFSFKRMGEEGIVPVMSHIEADFKTPLRSGDVMTSQLWLEAKGVRMIFHQRITNKSTGSEVFRAEATIVCLENGRISRCETLKEAFKAYLQ